jgi:hypothetical protein
MDGPKELCEINWIDRV